MLTVTENVHFCVTGVTDWCQTTTRSMFPCSLFSHDNIRPPSIQHLHYRQLHLRSQSVTCTRRG